MFRAFSGQQTPTDARSATEAALHHYVIPFKCMQAPWKNNIFENLPQVGTCYIMGSDFARIVDPFLDSFFLVDSFLDSFFLVDSFLDSYQKC